MILPWPSRQLNPNSRHKWKLINARKKQREDAFILAKQHKPFTGHLIITFNPPDKRRRDLDNCLSMMKGAIDGIAEAWGIDDKDFQPITIQWGEVIKNGSVEIQKGQ